MMSSADTSHAALGRAPIPFDNTYARLPERFYVRMAPAPVARPGLIRFNTALAEMLGLQVSELAGQQGVEIFAGNRVAEGSEPMALAYAGHQFGTFVRQLGDGRAHLLGEVVSREGRRFDLQLKGSGRTPFSRGGDGRAALGPVLREYVVSEAMAALGVPTTRTLAAVTSGETVYRESPLPGAVLTRVASSHLRVGTFEYFAARGNVEALHILAEYALERHYPHLSQEARRYRALLDGVVARQARLVAQWMALGFIHGVMNTDNTSISGETIDYGPCAFLEEYRPMMVFSSIDHQGRYAYGNQAPAMHWNMARLAECLLPLLAEEEGGEDAGLASAHQALNEFVPQYEAAYLAGMRRKLGLTKESEDDSALLEELLKRMEESGADFTLTFRKLCEAAAGNPESVRRLFRDGAAYDAWEAKWRKRMQEEESTVQQRIERMKGANPAYIPRNHQMQAVIDAAVSRQDFAPFEELLEVTARPFEERAGLERFEVPALPAERVTQTFCGT